MLWNYSNTTNTIWASFDYGTVEADNYDEAKEKAIQKLKADLLAVNTILSANEATKGFEIEMSFNNLSLTYENESLI